MERQTRAEDEAEVAQQQAQQLARTAKMAVDRAEEAGKELGS